MTMSSFQLSPHNNFSHNIFSSLCYSWWPVRGNNVPKRHMALVMRHSFAREQSCLWVSRAYYVIKHLFHISPINEFAVPDCICKSSTMLDTCLYQLHMMLFLSKRHAISSTFTIDWKIPLVSFCITSSLRYQYLSYPVPWHFWKYRKQDITYADNITNDDIDQDLIWYHHNDIKIWFDFG